MCNEDNRVQQNLIISNCNNNEKRNIKLVEMPIVLIYINHKESVVTFKVILIPTLLRVFSC